MRFLSLVILLLPGLAFSETFQVDYVEPSGTGFTEACVYSCVQYNTPVCTCVPTILRGCQANINGTTAESTSISFNIPIKDGQLPACVNYGVRTKDATGNESALVLPAGGSHVFTAP